MGCVHCLRQLHVQGMYPWAALFSAAPYTPSKGGTDAQVCALTLSQRLACTAATSARPGGDKGLMRTTAQLTLTRWDASRPATVCNLVLLSFDEAEEHEAAATAGGSKGGCLAQPEVAASWLAALRQCQPAYVAYVEAHLDRVRREHYY